MEFKVSVGGTAVAQWLRCCATNQKVAGSIPDGVTGIFHWHNPSGRTMALGSTQPLTEMSTGSISWGKSGRCVRLTILPLSCAIFTQSGNLNFLQPSGHLGPVMVLMYQRFITVFTRSLHLSLPCSWQPRRTSPYFLTIHLNIILQFIPRS